MPNETPKATAPAAPPATPQNTTNPPGLKPKFAPLTKEPPGHRVNPALNKPKP